MVLLKHPIRQAAAEIALRRVALHVRTGIGGLR